MEKFSSTEHCRTSWERVMFSKHASIVKKHQQGRHVVKCADAAPFGQFFPLVIMTFKLAFRS